MTGVENGNSGSGRGIKSSLGQSCTWTEPEIDPVVEPLSETEEEVEAEDDQ